MGQTLIPLFPLQVVLFPRTVIPLHIFEERYKEMIGDVLEAESEFGIVLAGERGICNSGCTAVIEKVVQQYEDGRMDLLVMGRRRFEIESLDDEKSYLRGMVEFFDDDSFDPVPAELKRKAIEGYEELRDIGEGGPTPQLEDSQLSFQLAQLVSDLNFRQTLLAVRSETERLRQLAQFLPGFNERQREAVHIRSVAPRNGHGKWPPSM